MPAYFAMHELIRNFSSEFGDAPQVIRLILMTFVVYSNRIQQLYGQFQKACALAVFERLVIVFRIFSVLSYTKSSIS